MKILMTGANGLIGSHLVGELVADGHQIHRLVRREPRHPDEIPWDPYAGTFDPGRLYGVGAVIHLAGDSVKGRWTRRKRRTILESRVRGTSLLARAIAGMSEPPRAFLCASAAAYGDRGEEILTDSCDLGRGFLAGVCREWEAATLPAARRGIRTVNLRFGLVLDSKEGALASMPTLFRLGLGGRLGNGKQYWSWITLKDALRAIGHVLASKSLAGPVNVVAPNPVTNRHFTKALGRALGRPTVCHVPAVVLRLALGQMADGLLLASVRAVPKKLLESGFVFSYPEIAGAVEFVLHR